MECTKVTFICPIHVKDKFHEVRNQFDINVSQMLTRLMDMFNRASRVEQIFMMAVAIPSEEYENCRAVGKYPPKEAVAVET